MRNSWLCIDANLVIRLVADPKDETVRQLWEQWDQRWAERHSIETTSISGALGVQFGKSNCMHFMQIVFG